MFGKKSSKKRISVRKILKNNAFSFKFLWRNSKSYFFAILITSLVGAVTSPLVLLLTNQLYAKLEAHSAFSDALVVMISILAVNLFSMAWNFFWGSFFQRSFSEKMRQTVQTGLFEKARTIELARYDDPKFYNDFILAMQYTDTYAAGALITFTNFIGNLFQFAATVTLLAYIDISVLAIILASAVLSSVINTKLNLLEMDYKTAIAPVGRRIGYLEGLFKRADYAKELRLTDMRKNVERDYVKAVKDHVKVTKSFGLRRIVLTTLDKLNSSGIYMAVMALTLYKLAVTGTVTIAGFAVVINAIWKLRDNFVSLAGAFTGLPQQSMQIDKVRSFMEYQPEGEKSGAVPAPPFESIELHDVCFSYNGGEDVLHDVTLKLRRGEKIAIVGYNGAGKSTLIKLLMRLYDPRSGVVMYNGHEATEYEINSYRGRIGAVFQDYRIFSATVAENVLGDEFEESDRPRVLDALHRATFDGKLAELERGINTMLTREFDENGTNLSGGEAQKIAIARVFAGNYDIIIMDEPSAALDPMAEYELNKQIAQFATDKTVIFISHRLSTTRHADRIYMFEEGRVIEKGSHDELMHRGGKYAEMFTVQAEKYKADEEN